MSECVDCEVGDQAPGWEGRHGRLYCECGVPMVEGPAESQDAADLLIDLWKGGWLPCRVTVNRRTTDNLMPDCGECPPCKASKFADELYWQRKEETR